jgi:hypothetical protein
LAKALKTSIAVPAPARFLIEGASIILRTSHAG